MPRVLVLYATSNGHTRKVAAAIAGTLRSAGLSVDIVDAGDRFSPDPGRYTAVVVAAPVRAGRYAAAIRRWVKTHVSALGHQPTAFVSMCLGVLEKNPKTDATLQDILTRFFAETGWRPGVVKVAAGALLYTQYNWVVRWFIRRIAARAHGDVDTSRDYVYTDWKDLEVFAKDFAGRVIEAVPVQAAS